MSSAIQEAEPMHGGFKVQPNSSCSYGRMFELHRAEFDITRLFSHQSAQCVHFLCGHEKSDFLQDEHDLWHHKHTRKLEASLSAHMMRMDFMSDNPFLHIVHEAEGFFCNNYLWQEGCVFTRQVYLVGWYLFKNMIQIKIWT